MTKIVTFPELIGQVATRVTTNADKEPDELIFHLANGKSYMFYHRQDCCENVRIEDIDGPLDTLVGAPIIQAEGVSGSEDETSWGIEKWTFYKFGTSKGHVTVRWYGESNGYYSVDVDFREVITKD